MTRWFSSDWHLGHKNIHIFEPAREDLGRTLEDRDNALIDIINSFVKPDDEFYVLGDVAMGDIEYSLPLVRRVNGNKFLIPGNHDRCWYGNKPGYAQKWTPAYEQVGFTILDEEIQEFMLSNGSKVTISHFPAEGDSPGKEDRYENRRPITQLPIINGHVHSAWKTFGRQYNVGVDANFYKPVSEQTLVNWVESFHEVLEVQEGS